MFFVLELLFSCSILFRGFLLSWSFFSFKSLVNFTGSYFKYEPLFNTWYIYPVEQAVYRRVSRAERKALYATFGLSSSTIMTSLAPRSPPAFSFAYRASRTTLLNHLFGRLTVYCSGVIKSLESRQNIQL